MKTVLLISVMAAGLVIPMLAARQENPGRGLKRMLLALLLFHLAYTAYLTLVHPEVFVPRW